MCSACVKDEDCNSLDIIYCVARENDSNLPFFILSGCCILTIMVVTAHFIDEGWNLRSFALAFHVIDFPHTGEHLWITVYGIIH